MTEVNGKLFKITVKSPFLFSIGDTTNFSPYLREGIVEQVKVPVKFPFKSFGDSLTHPIAPEKNEMDLCDWEKIGRPELLHVVYNALLVFASKHNDQLPELNNDAHAKELVDITKQINDSDRGEGCVKADIDEDVVKRCALFARA
jgi:ubiquitin-activating enzyme E1